MFKTRLATAMREKFADEEAFSRDALLPELNEGLPIEELFGTQEATTILEEMAERNEIFYSEEIVYRL
jgi:DNA replication licensing factor MCM3